MGKRLVQAIQNYETMLRLHSAGSLTEQEIAVRVQRYSASAAEEWTVLDSTRPILRSHGIPAHQFPMYHAFSRQLGKLKRQGWTQARIQDKLRSILERWILRGLDEAALEEIAVTVFNLQLPSSECQRGSLTH